MVVEDLVVHIVVLCMCMYCVCTHSGQRSRIHEADAEHLGRRDFYVFNLSLGWCRRAGRPPTGNDTEFLYDEEVVRAHLGHDGGKAHAKVLRGELQGGPRLLRARVRPQLLEVLELRTLSACTAPLNMSSTGNEW